MLLGVWPLRLPGTALPTSPLPCAVPPTTRCGLTNSREMKKRPPRPKSLVSRLLGRLVDVPAKEWQINKPGKVYRWVGAGVCAPPEPCSRVAPACVRQGDHAHAAGAAAAQTLS